MPDIKAYGKLNNFDVEAPVVNPGDSYGWVWLIEVGCGFSSVYYAVEADSATNAINEFSESKWGHHILVEDDNLDDYPKDSRYYNDGGQVCDLENIVIHGDISRRSKSSPWSCVYKGANLPEEGVVPNIYNEFLDWVESDPRK